MESNPVLAERVGDGNKQKWSREATVSTERRESPEKRQQIERLGIWALASNACVNLCTSTGLLGDLLEVTDPLCARIMEGIKWEMHKKCLAQDLALIIRKARGDPMRAGWGTLALSCGVSRGSPGRAFRAVGRVWAGAGRRGRTRCV